MIFSCYLLGSFWGSYETIMSFDVLILIALIIAGILLGYLKYSVTFHLFSKNSEVVVMIVKLYGFFFLIVAFHQLIFCLFVFFVLFFFCEEIWSLRCARWWKLRCVLPATESMGEHVFDNA